MKMENKTHVLYFDFRFFCKNKKQKTKFKIEKISINLEIDIFINYEYKNKTCIFIFYRNGTLGIRTYPLSPEANLGLLQHPR